MSDVLYVMAASYDDVEDALAEYEAIKVAYRHVGSSHDFDATVIAKDEAGRVDIVRGHDEPKRHGTAVGLNWGLAAGAVAALFPAVGILGALAVGGGAGAAIGAVAGHAERRDDARRSHDAGAGPGRGRGRAGGRVRVGHGRPRGRERDRGAQDREGDHDGDGRPAGGEHPRRDESAAR